MFFLPLLIVVEITSLLFWCMFKNMFLDLKIAVKYQAVEIVNFKNKIKIVIKYLFHVM
jgi:hypothetical protein